MVSCFLAVNDGKENFKADVAATDNDDDVAAWLLASYWPSRVIIEITGAGTCSDDKVKQSKGTVAARNSVRMVHLHKSTRTAVERTRMVVITVMVVIVIGIIYGYLCRGIDCNEHTAGTPRHCFWHPPK